MADWRRLRTFRSKQLVAAISAADVDLDEDKSMHSSFKLVWSGTVLLSVLKNEDCSLHARDKIW